MFVAGFWRVATSHAASVMTPSSVRSSYIYVIDVQARANTCMWYLFIYLIFNVFGDASPVIQNV
jgi:hypothetical protein